MSTPIRVAVVGATGYIGSQCVALLSGHPQVRLTRLLAHSQAGKRFCDAVPGSRLGTVLEAGYDPGDADVVMAALPHTVAASHAASWLEGGRVVIDLSADFRLRDAEVYQRWYGIEHPAPELCAQAVYALPELPGKQLGAASLIAAPGCYPTATLLAVAPALRAGLVEPDVIVDAKSGVSGAGRSASLGVHYAEVTESLHAYGVEGHRHKAEMVQELEALSGGPVRLTFVPHLTPMTRGLLATCYLRPMPGVSQAQLVEAYEEFCDGRPFLRMVGAPPATKTVARTNVAALHVGWQDGVAVVTCAEDNLIKGAAGQAIQALNLRFGFDETAGLPMSALWP